MRISNSWSAGNWVQPEANWSELEKISICMHAWIVDYFRRTIIFLPAYIFPCNYTDETGGRKLKAKQNPPYLKSKISTITWQVLFTHHCSICDQLGCLVIAAWDPLLWLPAFASQVGVSDPSSKMSSQNSLACESVFVVLSYILCIVLFCLLSIWLLLYCMCC